MKIVCELSGGADSALAAVRAKNIWPDARIYALFINYGQPYADIEKIKSGGLAYRFGFSWFEVMVMGLFENVSLPGKAGEYFPLRNVVLSAIACSMAERVGAEIVVNGSKSLVPVEADPYSFKDSTALFYAVMTAAVHQAGAKGIEIRQLLAENRTSKLSKIDVYRELRQYGVYMDDTFSCYHPYKEGSIWHTCGKCKNCLEKEDIANTLYKELV